MCDVPSIIIIIIIVLKVINEIFREKYGKNGI